MVWCQYHKDDPPAADDSDTHQKSTDIEKWDQEYISVNVDQQMLFDIILVSMHPYITHKKC